MEDRMTQQKCWEIDEAKCQFDYMDDQENMLEETNDKECGIGGKTRLPMHFFATSVSPKNRTIQILFD